MKRILPILFIITILVQGLNAQLPDGTLAPNFKGTDINGNEVELYDLLEQGYEVVLDFSATWCGPCWSYHETHELENLYQTYGPEGSKEVYVIFIESDDSTTHDDLIGNTSGSYGDWTEGVSYPILDNAGSIASAYNIAYYPTIFTVCGGGILTETERWTATEHYNFTTEESCRPTDNEISLFAETQNLSICEGPTYGDVNLLNSGTNPITSATIVLDGCQVCPIEKNWTGELNYLQYETIVFDDLLIDENGLDLSYTVINVEDGNNDNNVISQEISFSSVETTDAIEVTITLDCYPGETSWFLENSFGEVVYTSRQYGDDDIYMTYTEVIQIPEDDCYNIVLRDAYGDGLNGLAFDCTSDGEFSVVSGGVEISMAGGSEQFSEVREAFSASMTTNVDEIEDITFAISPNPASDRFIVEVDDINLKTKISLFNSQGKKILSNIQANSPVNTTDLTEGIYFVELKTENNTITRKMIIQ